MKADVRDATCSDAPRTDDEQSLANLLEEMTQALDAGEQVELEDVIAAHPQYAERLRDLMPAMLAMASWGKASESNVGAGTASACTPQLNSVLGDFRILEEIGRGGMGTVYEAEQISMGRPVALKVLPFAALADDRALRRFRNEVRAAAALDHPHIVSVHAVGEVRGIHFYSMQLVRGQSLAHFILQLRRDLRLEGDKARTDTPTVDSSELHPGDSTDGEQARLSTVAGSRRDTRRYRIAAGLGIQAAEALQYAHDQGILHRDIKPANLLLDREGQLHVTDFGLARIEADAGMTMTGDIVGTLRYMAPERALAKRVVIDHRADIYSLGATLYELLTLQPAFGKADHSELLKQIAFDEPMPLRKVDRDIPVDLQTIVLKSMAKNANDRYQTAQELADDLQAFLDDRPITAKPPTLLQRAGKWSRRHRGFVWATVATLLVLTLGSLLSTTLLLAERQQTQLAVAQRQAVVDFLVNELLAAPVDEKRQDRAVTVSEVLANAEDRIGEAFDEQPLVEATVRQAIAKTYHMLKESGKAEPHARRSLKLRMDLLGPIHHDTLEATTTLAEVLVALEKVDEARRLSKEALQNTKEGLGSRHPDSIDSMNRMVRVALADRTLGKAELDQLQELCQRALESSREVLGAEHRHTLTAMKLQADLLHYRGDTPQAEARWNETLKLSRRFLGPRDRLTISLASDAAGAYDNREQRHEAIQMYEEVVEGQRRTLGVIDPETIWSMQQLTRLYNDVDRFGDAQRLAEEGRAATNAIYGPDHAETTEWKQQLAFSLRGQKRVNESSRLQEDVLAWCRRNLGNDDPRTIFCIGQLGYDYFLLNRLDEAIPLLDESIRIGREVLGPASFPVEFALTNRARALHAQGRVVEARRQLEEIPEEPSTNLLLARWLAEEGKFDRARELLKAAEESLSSTDWFHRNLLAWALATADREEMRDGQRAVELATRACELTGYESATVLDSPAAAYAEVGDFESAVKWGEKAVFLAPGFAQRQKYSRRLEAFRSGKPWRTEINRLYFASPQQGN